jgi:FkbM family methyltransferase
MTVAGRLRPLQAIAVPMRDGRRLFLDLREPMCMPYLLTGEIWEEEGETCFVRHLVGPGDVAFDVGSNVGWYTTLLADLVGSRGHVYALEPNPVAYRLLALTARGFPQITTVEAAAGEREGVAELHIPQDAGMASLAAHPRAREHVRCRKVTLDRVWAEAGSPNVAFIKCDAEGAEREILEGAEHVLGGKTPPVLMLELGPLSQDLWGYRAEEIVHWISERFPGVYRGFRLHSETGYLEALPEPIRFRFDAIFLPEWASGRLEGYRGVGAETRPAPSTEAF